jgi:hypothetical protein
VQQIENLVHNEHTSMTLMITHALYQNCSYMA